MQQSTECSGSSGDPIAPPPLSGDVPPVIASNPPRTTALGRQLLLLLLSLCLALFLADAVVSLVDDTLIVLFGVTALTGFRAVVGLFAVLFVVVIYVLMGLTPMIPKRFFMPVALFMPVVLILSVPFIAVFWSRMQLVAWVISLLQVLVGLGVLYWVQGGWKLRWPVIVDSQLGRRAFSWLNLGGFVGVNLLVLLPAAVVTLVLGVGFTVHHMSDGFVGLRPGGMTVQVREYVRDDGRKILLVPMAHVGESDFYRALSDSFPSNAMILMEGVTDDLGLITNKVEYKQMARSLGLAEQEQEFNPSPTQVVHADVDVQVFEPATIDFLNLIMLGHSKGFTPEVIKTYLQNPPEPGFEQGLFEDLLGKRNRRLLEEVHARLIESDHLIIPWGAAHMPGIARGIRASGFEVADTRDHVVIRFGADQGDSSSN